MEMKIVKSRPPDIRLKKHAEVKIHKKDFLPSMNQKKEVFSARKPDFSFQKGQKKDIPDRKQARREQTRTVHSQKSKKEGKRLSIPVTPETLQKKVTPENVNDSEALKELAATGYPDVDKNREPFGRAMEENRKDNEIERRKKVRAEKRRKGSRAIGRMTQTVGNGIRLGGQIILQQAENETDSKETFYVMDRAIRLSEKRDIEKNAEKIRKPEREMKIRKKGRMQREVKKKQKTQAIRERKLAYW